MARAITDAQAIFAGMDSPANGAAAVTTNDSTDLAIAPCRSLYIGTTGDVKVDTASGDTVTFTAVPVGILPVRCKRVYATGTSASTIIALY